MVMTRLFLHYDRFDKFDDLYIVCAASDDIAQIMFFDGKKASANLPVSRQTNP